MNLVTSTSQESINFRTRIEVTPNEDGKYIVELAPHEWATHLVLMPYTAQEGVSVGRTETADDIVASTGYAVLKDSENNILKQVISLNAVNGSFYINNITGTCYVYVLVNPNIL